MLTIFICIIFIVFICKLLFNLYFNLNMLLLLINYLPESTHEVMVIHKHVMLSEDPLILFMNFQYSN